MIELNDGYCPIYRTRGEVLKAAHDTKCFYVGFCEEPFKEALKHSWTLYQK